MTKPHTRVHTLWLLLGLSVSALCPPFCSLALHQLLGSRLSVVYSSPFSFSLPLSSHRGTHMHNVAVLMIKPVHIRVIQKVESHFSWQPCYKKEIPPNTKTGLRFHLWHHTRLRLNFWVMSSAIRSAKMLLKSASETATHDWCLSRLGRRLRRQ